MIPPIFPILSSDSAVKAILGSNPVRVYPFGEAEQGVTKPYAVWQNIAGSPENYLGDLPDADSYTAQIDIYADTSGSALDAAMAIRDALEPVAYVTSLGNTSRDSDTRDYRYSMSVDFIVNR